MLREKYRHRIDLQYLKNRGVKDLETEGLALLVLDMQDFFISPESHAFVPSAPDLVPVIIELAEEFEMHDLPVVYTRHLNTEENSRMMGRWWRDTIVGENPLSKIHSMFDTSWAGVIEKSQYDAFYNTSLDELLHQLGVKTVVITGVLTNLCCETTARSAFVRGYRVLMPVDGTATMNMELHRATTANLAHGFSEPVSISPIIKSIRGMNAH
ncbi:MAG: isochorismatase family protein [Candidatus Sabulitectum sp.]|nr:isochorismatase family protein [Candidatus Sabulitectum sp.]